MYSWPNSGCRSGVRFDPDLPHAAAVGAGAEDVQLTIQLDLEDLGVGESPTEAAPGNSEVRGGIDTVIGPDVKGTVVFTDLKRPHRLIGKIAADIRPAFPAVCRAENRAAGVKSIDHGVYDLGIARVNLEIVDQRVTRNGFLHPGCAMISSHKNLAVYRRVDGIRVGRSQANRIDRAARGTPSI